MRAGTLHYPITIQEPVAIKDGYGANSIDWRDVISTRSNVTYNSGNRQNQNNEIVHSYTVTFTVRYYHKVNENHRANPIKPIRYCLFSLSSTTCVGIHSITLN